MQPVAVMVAFLFLLSVISTIKLVTSQHCCYVVGKHNNPMGLMYICTNALRLHHKDSVKVFIFQKQMETVKTKIETEKRRKETERRTKTEKEEIKTEMEMRRNPEKKMERETEERELMR